MVEPADDETSDRRPSVGVGGHEIHDIRDARDEAGPTRGSPRSAADLPSPRAKSSAIPSDRPIDDRRRQCGTAFLRRLPPSCASEAGMRIENAARPLLSVRTAGGVGRLFRRPWAEVSSMRTAASDTGLPKK